MSKKKPAKKNSKKPAPETKTDKAPAADPAPPVKATGRDIVPETEAPAKGFGGEEAKAPDGVLVKVVGYSHFGYNGKRYDKGAQLLISQKAFDAHPPGRLEKV